MHIEKNSENLDNNLNFIPTLLDTRGGGLPTGHRFFMSIPAMKITQKTQILIHLCS